MDEQQNIACVRRLFDEGWNRGRLEVVDDVVAADAAPPHPGVPAGPQGWKQQIRMYRDSFPDIYYAMDDVIAADDRVVVRWTAVATDTVGFMGQPPTGKRATVTGITIYRLAAGKLVEHWDEWDLAGLLQQLGAPAPAGARA